MPHLFAYILIPSFPLSLANPLIPQKWQREHAYTLRKELFAFTDNKIAVQFWYEYRDASDGMKWKRCYGLEDWTFDDEGKMRKRMMSGNDVLLGEGGGWGCGGGGGGDGEVVYGGGGCGGGGDRGGAFLGAEDDRVRWEDGREMEGHGDEGCEHEKFCSNHPTNSILVKFRPYIQTVCRCRVK